MISFDRQKNGEGTTNRQLRKMRILRSWKFGNNEQSSDDLPVFLANPYRVADILARPASEQVDHQSSLAAASQKFRLALASRKRAAADRWSSLQSKISRLPSFRFQSPTPDPLIRAALVALLLPLVLLAATDHPSEPPRQEPLAAAQPEPPTFDLAERLEFAKNLQKQIPADEIAMSFEHPPMPKSDRIDSAPTRQPAEEKPKPSVPDSVATELPSVAMDDQHWRLPFDSQEFTPSELPSSPEESFRAETAVSALIDKMDDAARDDTPDVGSPPIANREVARPKKALAQKRRSAPNNQMTASATPAPAPSATPQQPNLPPPPILFFLGAPPPAPATQPSQPAPAQVQAAKPVAPAPSPPPTSKPWIPESLSDTFKNSY